MSSPIKPKSVSKQNETSSMVSQSEQEFVQSLNLQVENEQIDINFGLKLSTQSEFGLRNAVSERNWTFEDENILIGLHRKHGNKWTLIARQYEKMCQNSIKNRFYSRLRKSIRKLNKAIGVSFLKRYNKFKLNIIFKLSNISQGKMAEKQKIAPQIFMFYRDYLYKLIEFSNQNQNDTQNQSFQNVALIENLILPLVALENLFRLVRGERVAKGKKKNIAYLRQFNFNLSLQNSVQMVIAKENIHLLNHNENSNQDLYRSLPIQEKQGNKLPQRKREPRETQRQENWEQLIFDYSNEKNYYGYEDSEIVNTKAMSPLKTPEEADCNTQTEVWKDYFGDEMKEYDICGHGDNNLDHPQGFEFSSFKSSSFIDEHNIW